jgi:hypothetical protein
MNVRRVASLTLGLLAGLGLALPRPAASQVYGPSSRRLPGRGATQASTPRPSLAPIAAGRPMPAGRSRVVSMDAVWREFTGPGGPGTGYAGGARPAGAGRAAGPATRPATSAARPYVPRSAAPRRHTCTPSRASVITRAPVRGPYREEPAPPGRFESWGDR